MKVAILSLSVVLGLNLCVAQQPGRSKVTAFEIGVTHAQAWSRYGAPTSFYLDGEHFKAVPRFGHGLLWEVYARRSGGIIYEARLLYEIDENSSRLHPSSKLQEVRFVFDRPLGARKALGLIPDALAACAHGCDVFAYSAPGEEHLKVRSHNGTDENPALALSWVAADEVTEQPVTSLDDKVTEIDIYSRSLDLESTEFRPTGLHQVRQSA